MSFSNLSEVPISLTLLNSLRSFPSNSPHNFPPEFIHKISLILSNSSSSLPNSNPRSYLALHYYLSIIDNIEDLTNLFNPNFPLAKPDLKALNKTNIFNIHSLLNAINGLEKGPTEAENSTGENIESNNMEKFRVHITENKTGADAQTLFISSDLLELTMNSRGRFDLDFVSIITTELNQALGLNLHHYLLQSPEQKSIASELSSTAHSILQQSKEISYTDSLFQSHLETFTQEKDVTVLMSILADLEHIVYYVLLGMDQQSRDLLKRLFICLLGHREQQVREKVVVYLNILNDGIEWQLRGGYKTIISTVGSEFNMSYILKSEPELNSQNIIFLLYSFPFDGNDEPPLLSWHKPEITSRPNDPTHIIASVDLGVFPRAGFYDWKFVRLDKGGKMNSMYSGFRVKNEEDEPEETSREAGNSYRSKVLQGRYVVHPRHTRDLEIHEVYADYPEGVPGEENFGSFAKIRENLQTYTRSGINCLYVMGALERNYGGTLDKKTGKKKDFKRKDISPMAVTCRTNISSVLGGPEEFRELIQTAKARKVDILVDYMTRVSSASYHKKYKNLLLQTADSDGILTLAYGAEGRARKYGETVYLNYRKKEAWDLLIEEAIELIQETGASGLYLDDAQNWPQIFEMNEEELLREENDGSEAYSMEERFYGNVIIQNKFIGYWNTMAKNKYANPMLVEFCRKLWQKFPNIIFIGEAWGGQGYDHRELCLIKSGVVPRLYKIPPALATVYGKRLGKDGSIVESEIFSINAIRTWYEDLTKTFPQGSIVIQSTTSHSWPYPAYLFRRGTWSFIDLMFFFPHIPMTFMGETSGHAYRCTTVKRFQTQLEKSQGEFHGKNGREAYVKSVLDAEDKFFAAGELQVEASVSCKDSYQDFVTSQEAFCREIGPEYGYDLKQIYLHYEHRRQLRRNLEPLKKGKLIPLLAEHAEGYHSHVLAYARVLKKEMTIIATNFNEFNVFFGINMKSLKYLFDEYDQESLEYCVIKINDHIGTAFDDHYSVFEFLNGQIDTSLKPHASLIWGATIIFGDKELYEKTLVRSLERTKVKIARGQTVGGNEVIAMLTNMIKELDSVQEFANNLGYIYRRFLKPTGISIPQILNSIQEIQDDSELCAKLFAFCTILSDQAPKTVEGFSHKAPKAKLSFDETSAEAPLGRPKSFSAYPRKTSEGVVTYTTGGNAPRKTSEMIDPVTNEMNTIFDFVHDIIDYNSLGSIAFITPELGRWSTIGGLGVMLDELSIGLVELGEEVIVVTPYWERNRKGETGYLERDPDGISYIFNLEVHLGDGRYVVGVHHGVVKGVRIYFLHNSFVFPHPYADGDAKFTIQQLCIMAKATLELFCKLKEIPSVIVTNDWFTALVPAYPKNNHFGDIFNDTKFIHIVHNLDPTYEGRIYPNPHDGFLEHIHNLPQNLFVDPYWSDRVLNPSRCALLSSDQWGTVSFSYKQELLEKSPLTSLLKAHKQPFAFPNGIPKQARFNKILQICNNDHHAAKELLQKKYFKLEGIDDSLAIFGFVGRITQQKGVHLILENMENLINKFDGKVQFILGGMVNMKDPYGSYCAGLMYDLLRKYPKSFWASPNDFFTDGSLLNVGADFGLMPSLFEPGGIVQQEFFVGSTPVVAFQTGGLKDTVFEFDSHLEKGNGFVFKNYNGQDFTAAIERAIGVFNNPDKYKTLRKNAFNSTIDVEDVSRAWNKEFHRLFNKSFIDPVLMKSHKEKINNEFNEKDYQEKMTLKKIKLEMDLNNKAHEINQSKLLDEDDTKSCMFVYRTVKLPKPKDVMLTGSFNDWKEPVPMNHDHILGRWSVTVQLKPGEYLYKFIVDNRWICTDDDPKVTDIQGNLNNCIHVQ